MQHRLFVALFSVVLLSLSAFMLQARAADIPVTSAQASSELWPAANAIDGNIGTVWTSGIHANGQNIEWLAYWFNGFNNVNYVKLYPRYSGSQSLCFPVNFRICWFDGSTWIQSISYIHYPSPNSGGWVTIPLPETVNCNGIWIIAGVMGTDGANYAFQMAEATAGYDASLEPVAPVVSSATASSAIWPTANAIDGNVTTVWSSGVRPKATHKESLTCWLNSTATINHVKMRPRYGSTSALGFPVSFRIKTYDGSVWATEITHIDFPTPIMDDWIVLPLPQAVNAQAVMVEATVLGQDDVGNYVFQLAELATGYDDAFVKLAYLGNGGDPNNLELRNIGSDAFNDPSRLKVWNHDTRNPIIVPQSTGAATNIYAPSIVYNGAWNIYFGGWDGTPDFHDRVSITTSGDNFLSFSPHYLMVDNGEFGHLNNATIVKASGSDWHMMYTTLAYGSVLNRPGVSYSSNGVDWTPSAGSSSYLLNMTGYSNWANADINGGNVIFYEGGVFHMYFHDFNNFNGVYHATSTDGFNYAFSELAYNHPLVPNDLKAFTDSGATFYLLAMHLNGPYTFYSVSTDKTSFPPYQTLFEPAGTDDNYITSVGLVSDGSRLYGALYGAGSNPALTENTIHAAWLQKKVRFVIAPGYELGDEGEAYGPDRVLLNPDPAAGAVGTGHFEVYDSDGESLVYKSPRVTVRLGDVWEYLP